MADIRAEDLTQETKSTLDGSEQFIMFDSTEGKRGTVSDVGDYILQNGDASGQGDTVADMIADVPTGDTVSFTQTQTSGDELGTITINGTGKKIYGKSYASKQDALVSGTNIKTINGNDLLGSGNIVIQGGGGSTVSYTQTQTSGNELGTITIDGDSKKIYSPTETDPVYSASPAAGITSANISAWNGMAPKDWVSTNNTTLQNTMLVDANSPTGIFASANGWYAGTTNYPTYFANEFGAVITVPYRLGTGLNDAMQLFFDENGNASCRKREGSTWKGWTSIGGAGADVTQVSITVANWNATTTCTKSVTGVTSSNSVIVTPAPASISTWTSNGVYCSAQGSGTLTFTCTSTPSADITVNIMIVG